MHDLEAHSLVARLLEAHNEREPPIYLNDISGFPIRFYAPGSYTRRGLEVILRGVFLLGLCLSFSLGSLCQLSLILSGSLNLRLAKDQRASSISRTGWVWGSSARTGFGVLSR